MNRLQQKTTGILLAGLLLSSGVTATELVYTPVNPSFGGSPLNGAWLLGNAQAQNDTKDPDAIDRSSLTGTSALDRFTSQLQSSLLSELLTDFRNGTSNDGTLTTDDFIVNIVNLDGNLTVQITDRLTGEVSEVIVNGYGAATN
ncbi:curli assembly protein CsgF [Pseudomonas stutzeri]|uniref:curli assembly protein CsgF n=1 Tax=Stutzerimonas stutzeri TaxID=316 RepID=UPI00210B80DC|nr:curli assembly protein CsgF [Stutzerimonas stutzeri]MCQ4313288.1 curli assembly protein CsgF [Stutzerimonas stutzeri]